MADLRGVLRRDHDGIDPDRREAVVFDRHLALGVGPQPGNRAILAKIGDPVDDPVGQGDRQRHELFGVIAGKAEHHSLIAGTDVFAGRTVFIDTLGDVGRLLAERDHDGAGRRVETHVAGCVADVADDLADDRRIVDHGLGRDLAGQADQPRGEQTFAGHSRVRILLQDRIEDAVGNLVGHLVGMAHRHGFAGEQVAVMVRHGRRSPRGRNIRSCHADVPRKMRGRSAGFQASHLIREQRTTRLSRTLTKRSER